MIFGEFLRNKRISLKYSLRNFCNRFGFDPAYISRLENNIIKPSMDEDKLSAIATSLGIEKHTEEWVIFNDLAYQANNEIPNQVKKEVPELSSLLPAFLRTRDNKKISKEKAKRLIEFLKKGGDDNDDQ